MKSQPKENTTTYRPFLERLGGSPVSEFVGEYGELFYDPANPTLDSLRISDGKTKGGIKISDNLRQDFNQLLDTVEIVRDNAVELLNETAQKIEEGAENLDARKLPINLTFLPSL